MKRPLQLAILAASVASGCNTIHIANRSAEPPLRYRDTRHGLTFFLPPTWRGYSASVHQLEVERYSPAEDKPIVVGYIPMIVLRHSHWQSSDRYQDIPILVFTHTQWDALHHGELWPSLFAGGTMDELWHNQQFVFAISSRYNAADGMRGWEEVAEVVAENRAANKMPHLYPE